MRLFLTGATGYIGGEVAKALRRSAFEVAALVRPDSEAGQLRELGVVLIAGDLKSLPSIPLDGYDAFVHTASAATDREEADRIAVDTFTATGKPLVYTSGVWVLGNTERAHEGSPVNPLPLVAWRPAHEERVLGSGGAVIRPGCVYGGRQSLLADWFAAAEQNRPLQLVGDGTQRWAMVDLHDLGELYLRVIQQQARGVLHGIDDSHDSLEACARAIAPNGTIEKIPLELARTAMGPFADALAVDQVISSAETRQKLGWQPRRTFIGSVEEQRAEFVLSSRARERQGTAV
jgi:nucleoside-diphosphate-sugar epimerase